LKISAALIMKNEEDNLSRLLKSLQGKFDEIVVVDTGSEDRSIEIAKSFGCKVFQKEWNGFADARNFAIQKCSGDWIWHFDADFELEESEFEKFRKVVEYLKEYDKNCTLEAIFVKVKNYGLDGTIKGISSQAFIHRNKNTIRWIGNIHEELLAKSSHDFNIYVNHFGYSKSNVQIQKAYRNLELIKKDLDLFQKDKRKYFIKLFYLFQTIDILATHDTEMLKDVDLYLKEFKQLKEKFKDERQMHFFIYYAHVYIADILRILKKYDEGLQFCREALDTSPIYPDIYIAKARILEENNQINESVDTYLNFLVEVEEYEKYNFNRNGQMVVIDNYSQVNLIIEKIAKSLGNDEILIKVNNLWKSKRSKFAGLILAFYYYFRNHKKLYKHLDKLYKKYNEDERVLQCLLLIYEKIDQKRAYIIAKRLHGLNNKNLVANRFLGLYYKQHDAYEQALLYLNNVLLINEDITVISLYIDVLKKAGFGKEAVKLEKHLKELKNFPFRR